MNEGQEFSVLMVCTGNICRSAMAQVVLAAEAQEQGIPVRVDSCGISDEEHGNPMDARAARTLREAGFQVPYHTARQMTRSDLENFDLILTMTKGHYRAVERLASRYGLHPDIRMYRSFEDGPRHSEDVPDPWYGDMRDFQDTLHTIEKVTPNILAYIKKEELR